MDLKKCAVKLSDGTELQGDIIVNSIPVDELCGYVLGELPFAGRDFVVFVLPCKEVFPDSVRFCHYTQHEAYTRIVEYKKLTFHDAPDTLLGIETPSNSNKLYPYMIKKHLDTAGRYLKLLPENVFSIGRAGSYKYSTIEQTISQAFSLFETVTGKSTEEVGKEFYAIGDMSLIKDRKAEPESQAQR